MISQMRRDFWDFWDAAPESTHGGWERSQVGMYKSKAFLDQNILRLREMVKQRELQLLVNLVHLCESQFGPGIAGGRGFDRVELDAVLTRVPEFSTLYTVLPAIVGDLRHRKDFHVVDITARRRFLYSQSAEKRHENPDDQGTMWILFLNDDYKGGELFFPTREIVLKPKAGSAVRWPTGIPYGIAMTDDGFQFTLSARNVAEPAAHDKIVVLTDA